MPTGELWHVRCQKGRKGAHPTRSWARGVQGYGMGGYVGFTGLTGLFVGTCSAACWIGSSTPKCHTSAMIVPNIASAIMNHTSFFSASDCCDSDIYLSPLIFISGTIWDKRCFGGRSINAFCRMLSPSAMRSAREMAIAPFTTAGSVALTVDWNILTR